VILNNDKHWQVQKEIKIMTLEETARYLKTCENKGRITRNNGHPEEGICEEFPYVPNSDVYPIILGVNELGVIFEDSLFSNFDLTRCVKKLNKLNLSDYHG